MIQYELKHLAV